MKEKASKYLDKICQFRPLCSGSFLSVGSLYPKRVLEAAKRMTMNGHDVSLRENEVSIFDQVICNKYLGLIKVHRPRKYEEVTKKGQKKV